MNKSFPEIPDGFFRISIKALILDKDKKFMLIREDDGSWEIPGGGMESGENYKQTLIREINEEMGLIITEIGRYPAYFTRFINTKDVWAANIIFEVKVRDLLFTPTEECREIGFFNKETAANIKLLPSVKAFLPEFDPKRH